ncbi:hypothetical protein [Bradyrhizobium sp.]|uniref:hypothetical protein n=1 Tax=Bradyrhizobium sp. TaxID=376 RepID=UPI003C46CE6D
MRSFFRIMVMVIVSALTFTVCGGGYRKLDEFLFVGMLVVMFWGLPLIGLVTLLHFVERRLGRIAGYVIATIGLIPLGLVIAYGPGDPVYSRIIVVTGLGWSAAWIVTSLIFLERETRQVAQAS